MAQKGTASIPDALNIRANAAPAGTAILTTSCAVIDAMAAVGMAAEFQRHGGLNIVLMTSVTAKIRGDPTRYHKAYFAYGVRGLSPDEQAELNSAKAEAERFAPYAQAFINVVLRDAAMSRAKALKKHAEQNPLQMRRAAMYFQAFVRKRVATIEGLFNPTLDNDDI